MKAPGYQLLTFLCLFIGLSVNPAYSICVKNSEVCVQGPETRLINGESIYRGCWKYDAQYSCDGTAAIPDSHCQDLINAGCSPISQTCDTDSCLQTYECVTGSTSTAKATGCDNQTVSLENMAFDTGYDADTNFGLAASNLAAMESAVKGMVKDDSSCAETPPGSGKYVCAQTILIFNGKDNKCRKDSAGFNKCCNLNGWGTDIGISQCNSEEHELGYARQAKRTHYIGRYCTHDNVFGCYARAYVYCTFTSKIGRIIQEQGRAQLGIGWGSPEIPNCAGFTAVQLATINFDLIDFSEFFNDAFDEIQNPPSSGEMESLVKTYIGKLKGSECSQFDDGCVSGVKSE